MRAVRADDMVRADRLIAASHPRAALALPHQPRHLDAIAKTHAERARAVHEQLIEFLSQQHECGFAAAQTKPPPPRSREQQRMNGAGVAPDLGFNPEAGEHRQTERRNGGPARLVARKAGAVEQEYVRDAALGQLDRGRAAARPCTDNHHPSGQWILSGLRTQDSRLRQAQRSGLRPES